MSHSVIYIPNSSRFANREALMSRWYSNFYHSHDVGSPLKIVCVDEVLSGSSAVVGYKQFEKSVFMRAREMADEFQNGEFEAYCEFERRLHKNLSYKILGIAEKQHARNPQFNRLVNQRRVHTVEFDNVPTIDNVALNPLRFKVARIQKNGRPVYAPEIERFDITPEYMSLLKGIASYVGVDPLSVGPVNLGRIEEGLRLAREDTSKFN